MAETDGGAGFVPPGGDQPGSRRFPSESAVWTAVFILLGLAARTVRWHADTPFWGDEAAVALNLLDRGYRALAGPLDFGQLAPLGFLWSGRALLLRLGPSEAALRLVAFVAGVASLLCFSWLSSLACSWDRRSPTGRGWPGDDAQMAAVLPLALFAVSYYPIRYSAELKPYALDLLVACLLQCLAIGWLRTRPGGSARLWALAAAALLAPWFSYPSALVGGGIALALLPPIWRDRSRRTLLAYATFAAALAVGFASSYALVGRAQTLGFDGSGAWLARFWADSFPPAQPLAFVAWLARTHTGMMFAYPNGGPNGGSIFTLLLFLAGVATVARADGAARATLPARGAEAHRGMLGVLLAPFALAFVAACCHLYPYGGPIRTSLYLAPAICLFAGVGAAAALRWTCAGEARRRATRVLLGALVVLGAGTIVRDARNPHGVRDAVTEGRRIAAALTSEAAGACIVALNPAQDLVIPREGPNGPQLSFRFYLRRSAGARWSEGELPSAACRKRDGIRAVLFVDKGRAEPESRFGEWERRLLASADAGASSGLRSVRRRVACTTADCQETVHVRDYPAP